MNNCLIVKDQEVSSESVSRFAIHCTDFRFIINIISYLFQLKEFDWILHMCKLISNLTSKENCSKARFLDWVVRIKFNTEAVSIWCDEGRDPGAAIDTMFPHYILTHLAVYLHTVIFTLLLQSPQMYTKHSSAWVVNYFVDRLLSRTTLIFIKI